MKEYVCKIEIDKNDFERINRLMDVKFEDYESNHKMKKLIDELDARPDTMPYSFCFEFDDGSEILLDICSGSSNYYDSWRWVSAYGTNDMQFDCMYEVKKENVFVYGGITYVCKFAFEKQE